MLKFSRLKKIVASNKFLVLILLIFAIQGFLYSGIIKYGVPPDEGYHFNSIKYYANENIVGGPFEDDQRSETVASIGAIERNTSFLFHYLLSFPLRLMEALGLNTDMQIFLLRLINVIFVILALYVLRKCLDEISDKKALNNLVVFAFSLTGMLVWLASSINYDNLSILLFLLFVLFSIKSIKKSAMTSSLLALSFGLLTVLTKYTYIPEVFLGLLVVLFFVGKKHGFELGNYTRDLKSSLSSKKVLTAIILILAFTSSFLFVERVGGNLVRYHQVQPSCNKIFTNEECLTRLINKRNFEQKVAFENSDKGKLVKGLNPFGHSGSWFYEMYNGLYFYGGHKRIDSNNKSEFVAAIVLTMFIGTLFFHRKKIKIPPAMFFIVLISGFYISMLYLFNLNTLLNYGAKFAYQGRYILPVLGFIYFFAAIILINTATSASANFRKTFIWSWAFVLILALFAHSPPIIFFKNVDGTWREGSFTHLTSENNQFISD